MTSQRPCGHRSGITLTEILISILIMGVGMLSLATLFPLGLSKLRDAARNTRSALLSSTATGEVSSRDLFYKPSFKQTGYVHDPFTEDPVGPTEAAAVIAGLDRQVGPTNAGAYTGIAYGPGVPVCYDPLWWYEVFRDSGGGIAPSLAAGADYRFASGIGLLRNDPSGGVPSAHGLQRLTNFPLVTDGTNFAMDPASVMCSPDDPVMQTDGTGIPGRGSPIVPDMSLSGGMQRDYAYTWIFTGQQTDSVNGTIFDGDLVIFHNRPHAIDSSTVPNRAAGETVVEAIWGYGTVPNGTYSVNDRKVLLRWPSTQADPDVRVGGWIADVTYERNSGVELSRWYSAALSSYYPAQRCYWYRVAKRAEVVADPEVPGYRQIVVTLASPVKAKTPIGAGGTPLRLNACLVNPYVVNVVPRVFYTR